MIAGNDLNNIGGMIDAQNSLAVIAGRNVNIVTTTSDASSSAKTARGSIEQQRTVIDRVAGLYVSDPGGSLGVYAGGNVTTAGAQIVSGGSVEMRAKGEIKLDSVTTGQSETIRWSSRNSRIDGNSAEIGTTVSGAGNVTIKADGDISTRAAALSAGDVLSVDAGGKLRMVAGQNHTYAQTEYSQRSGMSYSRLEASSSQSTLARTTLDADKVTELDTLAQQPGMGWVNQLVNDPALVMLVVAVETFGATAIRSPTASAFQDLPRRAPRTPYASDR